jgi:hypothetical protein
MPGRIFIINVEFTLGLAVWFASIISVDGQLNCHRFGHDNVTGQSGSECQPEPCEALAGGGAAVVAECIGGQGPWTIPRGTTAAEARTPGAPARHRSDCHVMTPNSAKVVTNNVVSYNKVVKAYQFR